jgi:hypothetical protein
VQTIKTSETIGNVLLINASHLSLRVATHLIIVDELDVDGEKDGRSWCMEHRLTTW